MKAFEKEVFRVLKMGSPIEESWILFWGWNCGHILGPNSRWSTKTKPLNMCKYNYGMWQWDKRLIMLFLVRTKYKQQQLQRGSSHLKFKLKNDSNESFFFVMMESIDWIKDCSILNILVGIFFNIKFYRIWFWSMTETVRKRPIK